MAALDIVTLDTATPQLEVPQAADTYNAPRAFAIAPVSLTGSAATTSFDVTQTWDTTGTPTAIRLNVTDTASNAASLLMDLRVGGASQFNVLKSGALRLSAGTKTAPALAATGTNTGIYFRASTFFEATDGTNVFVSAQSAGMTLASGMLFGWSGGFPDSTGSDVELYRDATDALAQRRGTNAQTFRIYNTFTDASNYERLNIVATGSSFELVCQSAGTGTSRPLQLKAGASSGVFFGGGGAVQWQVNASGHFLTQTDNTYDIGASGATRPRDLFVGGGLTTGAPTGGTAAKWKLGVAATVSPTSPNRTIEVDIGGTIYYLAAKTTND
jgi:hypothetical protein